MRHKLEEEKVVDAASQSIRGRFLITERVDVVLRDCAIYVSCLNVAWGWGFVRYNNLPNALFVCDEESSVGFPAIGVRLSARLTLHSTSKPSPLTVETDKENSGEVEEVSHLAGRK